MGELKAIQIEVPGDRCDVALPPAPVIDKGLIKTDKTYGQSQNSDAKSDCDRPIARRKHDSRLDKPTRQSQSSTRRLREKTRRPRMNAAIRRLPFHPTAIIMASAVVLFAAQGIEAQAPPPPDAPDVVDYSKLLPLLPEAPSGWSADKPDGSTSDVGGFKLTNVHRDYSKGEGE